MCDCGSGPGDARLGQHSGPTLGHSGPPAHTVNSHLLISTLPAGGVDDTTFLHSGSSDTIRRIVPIYMSVLNCNVDDAFTQFSVQIWFLGFCISVFINLFPVPPFPHSYVMVVKPAVLYKR